MATTRKHIAISFHDDDLARIDELQKITGLDRSKTLVILLQYGLAYAEHFANWVKKNATAHNVHCVYTKADNLVQQWVYTLSYDFLPYTWRKTLLGVMEEACGNALETYFNFLEMYRSSTKANLPKQHWLNHIPEDQ